MKRRQFIKHVGHSLAVPGLVGSLGIGSASARSMQRLLRMATEGDKVLVVIYLDGGNDGLNTVIPLNRLDELNAVRPDVMLSDSVMLPLPDADLALHPSLQGLHSLYTQNKLGIIQNVGYPEQNYSHFRSSDIWMSASDAHEVISSGWMGRYLDQEFSGFPDGYPNDDMPDPVSVEIGYGSSMLFQGPTSLMSMVINNTNDFHRLLDGTEEEAPDTAAGDRLKHVRAVARLSQLYGQRVVDAANQAGNQLSYPDFDLANNLSIISRLISGGLKTPIYMVRIGGFDTHSDQVKDEDTATGTHAELLQQVNDGITRFMEDLEHLGIGDKVIGMTFSEFGRRIVSNASKGTDHGAAAPLFIFGNKVKGGVLGSNPVVDTGMTYEDNLPMEYDFRQVYSSVLEQWFGTDESQRDTVLFKDFETLDLIGDPVISGLNPDKKSLVNIYPNPLNGAAKIEYISDGKEMNISVMDLQGRLIETIRSGKYPIGKQIIQWNTSGLKEGRYFVLFRSRNIQFTKSVVKH